MRSKFWIILGLVAATGLAVGAERGLPGPQGLAREAGLSDAQAQQLKKMRIDGRKAAIRRRADLGVARIELRELLDAPSVDEKAVDAKVKEISELQTAALRARVRSHLALRQLLTPEQRSALERARARHGRPARRPRPEAGGDDAGTPPGGGKAADPEPGR